MRSSQCFKNLDLSCNSLSSIMTIIMWSVLLLTCFGTWKKQIDLISHTNNIWHGTIACVGWWTYLASSKVCPKMQRVRPCCYIDARTRGIGLPQALVACYLAISFCGPRKTKQHHRHRVCARARASLFFVHDKKGIASFFNWASPF